MRTERCNQDVRITLMSFLIISWSQRGSRYGPPPQWSFVILRGSDSRPPVSCSRGIFILWMSVKTVVPCTWTEWQFWDTVCFFQEDPQWTQSWSLVASNALWWHLTMADSGQKMCWWQSELQWEAGNMLPSMHQREMAIGWLPFEFII